MNVPPRSPSRAAAEASPPMRVLIYVSTAWVAVVTGVLCLYAREEEGRIEDVAITLAQDSEGTVIATVRNRSRGRLEFYTSSHQLQVLEAGVWRTPQPSYFGCGMTVRHQDWVGAGGRFHFRVTDGIPAIQHGQSIRVTVVAFSGYKTGAAVSDAMIFSRPNKT